MISNYIFVALLASFWILSFFHPTKRLKKNRKRLLWLTRLAFLWWLLGMSYYLLGFLIPSMLVPKAINSLLSVTLALPCRLGIGFEHFRANALSLPRFDMAWAMIWGLPFSLVCSGLVAALQTFLKTRAPLLHRSFRG